MRGTVTISLPKEMIKEVDFLAKKEYINRSDVVREALKRYLAVRKLHEIRRRVMPQARRRGIYTEEDVYRIVS